jgi:glycine oxidase
MVAALTVAFERAGGALRHARVASLSPDGLVLDDGTPIRAEQVLLATGAAQIELPDELRVPVRPVKGQTLRLRDPRGAGLVDRTIRGIDAYLVPRADGEYVLGATMEEQGFDTAPTAGGVYELLRDMS